jgi:hypothetical protein
LSVRSTLLALVLVLAGCGKADRQAQPTTRTAQSVTAPRGPDNLVLRIPRAGGSARVYAYPRLDTVVWSAAAAPAPTHVLAFDDEAGEIAYVDARGFPARIDFRQGGAGTVSRAKLSAITSSDGSTIYAIGPDGSVQRYAESGSWKWKPPLAARAIFPQNDGSLLVLGERKDGSVVWRLRPPSTDIVDSVVLPKVDRTLRTQVGDRLYLSAGKELTGIRTRTMEKTPSITLDDPVELLAATPSGDRIFVVTKAGKSIEVVDRYRGEKVSGTIDLGRTIDDLRIDPLGRYLLAHPAKSDSAIVIALSDNRIVGVLPTAWRADLPFVAPDGGIAAAQGADVVIVQGESLKPVARARGGAVDYWYPFRWTGFRPRDAALDRPVEFAGPTDSTRAATDSTAPRVDSPAALAPPPQDSVKRSQGFTVSFAALLVPERARELASQIKVGNEQARVITAMRDGSAIFRVVLGPYPTREEAERVGRESKQSYWVYEGGP